MCLLSFTDKETCVSDQKQSVQRPQIIPSFIQETGSTFWGYSLTWQPLTQS